jgi:hypothetical protein
MFRLLQHREMNFSLLRIRPVAFLKHALSQGCNIRPGYQRVGRSDREDRQHFARFWRETCIT